MATHQKDNSQPLAINSSFICTTTSQFVAADVRNNKAENNNVNSISLGLYYYREMLQNLYLYCPFMTLRRRTRETLCAL